MTVYVAHQSKSGIITIGCDSRIVIDEYKVIDNCVKMLFNSTKTRGIATAGNARIDTLIGRQGKKFWSTPNPDELLGRMKEMMVEDGWKVSDKDDGPHTFGVNGFIATENGLWHFSDCVTPTPIPVDQFMCSGSGGDLAEGAIYAARKLGVKKVTDLVTLGIEAACSGNTGCGLPVQIHEFRTKRSR